MADMIKDEIFGEVEYNTYVWWRSMDKTLYGSDVVIRVLVQDENQEGILDVQRKAYQTYLENEEKYIREVPKYVLDYYKWNFEEIDRVVELEPGDQKDTITEERLFEMCKVFFIEIARDGSFGWRFGCSWIKKYGFGVILSEEEPRILLDGEEFRYLHKMNDDTFGLLVHDVANSWKGLSKHSFFGEEENLVIELEGSAEDSITEAQKKAYAKYLERADEHFKDFSKMMLTVYAGSESKAEEMLSQGIPVNVATVLPKTLYIDKEGNYGWICYTSWDAGYIGVLLSDDEIYIMNEFDLREYRTKDKVKDEVLGLMFYDSMMHQKLLVVRLAGAVRTLPLHVRTMNGAKINDKVRSAYKRFLELNPTLWEEIKDLTLEYYLGNYDEFIQYIEDPDELRKNKVNRENIVPELLEFTSLYISSSDGLVGWLCESLTDDDGLAFEFTDGRIKLIPQPEII